MNFDKEDRTCKLCAHGDNFIPRKDEVERFGLDVMGCNRLNYEGYTTYHSTCEAFQVI
ncbi:MAG: hypothetical protein ACRCYS_10450 [Beijerinckiaceae bacterium]